MHFIYATKILTVFSWQLITYFKETMMDDIIRVQGLSTYEFGKLEAGVQVFSFFSVINNRLQTLITTYETLQQTNHSPALSISRIDDASKASILRVYPRTLTESWSVPAVMGVTSELWVKEGEYLNRYIDQPQSEGI